jgi:hypothetical protein
MDKGGGDIAKRADNFLELSILCGPFEEDAFVGAVEVLVER